MALAGAERWPQVAVERVIMFERSLAKATPTLHTAIARASGYAEPERYGRIVPSDAPFALMRAIELAFATDQIELGLKLCRQLVVDEATRPKTAMQFAQWATVGAILQLVRVEFTNQGIRYLARVDWQDELSDGQFFRPWPELGSQTRLLIQRSLPAAVLSGTVKGLLDEFFTLHPGPGRAGAWRFVATTDEYRVIEGFGGPSLARGSSEDLRALRAAVRSGSLSALRAMERNYQARLDAMRGASGWDNLSFRGNLLDWSLLAFYVLGLRKPTLWSRSVRSEPQAQFEGDDVGFLRGLAKTIVGSIGFQDEQ